MDKETGKLSVFFEEQFWVGVFERIENGKLTAAKVIFGAEPKDAEVYEFILKHYYDLRFSPAVAADVKTEKKNPKRIRREVKRQMSDKGVCTKSQMALKLQQEQFKLIRKTKSKEVKQAEIKRRFEQKQQKKKDKHRGR